MTEEALALFVARWFRELPGDRDDDGERLPRHLWERALLGPAREFLRRPGKGLRGQLLDGAYALAGGAGDAPAELGALIELVHAGSLVLDDIQDGSAERRGAPALHRVVGTGLALNTGSWMIFWPVHVLGQVEFSSPGAREEAYRRTTGALLACHQGQALDLGLHVGDLSRAELPEVVAMRTWPRTGRLPARAGVRGGGAAGAAAPVLGHLGELGRDLGRALQMLDDLGGLTVPARRAKGLEDLRLGRPTWVWAWAAERAGDAELAALQEEARRVRDGAGDVEALRQRLTAAVEELGRTRARAALDRASARLTERFGAAPARDQVAAEIERLGRSYG